MGVDRSEGRWIKAYSRDELKTRETKLVPGRSNQLHGRDASTMTCKYERVGYVEMYVRMYVCNVRCRCMYWSDWES